MSSRFLIHVFCLILIFIIVPFAQGITYEFDYNGEPAGDVQRFDKNGTATIVEGFKDLDLKKFFTRNGTGDNLTLTLGTSGKRITTTPDVKYVFRMFTDSKNKTGYNITYCNGNIELVQFDDGKEILTEDITSLGGIVKDKSEELLVVDIPKTRYLPEDELEYLGMDGFSWMEKGNYTYVDYIHDLPGNPGTIAPDVVEDAGGTGSGDDKEGGNFVLVAGIIIIVIIIVVVLMLLLMRKKK